VSVTDAHSVQEPSALVQMAFAIDGASRAVVTRKPAVQFLLVLGKFEILLNELNKCTL
jgi:hypothetical protein